MEDLEPHIAVDDQQYDDNEYADVQSRAKASNRYKTSPLNNVNPRFLFNMFSSMTFTDPVKTATFTLTSTVNITSVQSCISSSLFASGSSNVICRRKRDLPYILGVEEPEDQFAIYPSEPQE